MQIKTNDKIKFHMLLIMCLYNMLPAYKIRKVYKTLSRLNTDTNFDLISNLRFKVLDAEIKHAR